MRELTRSNDPVLLSFLDRELAAEGIDTMVLDGFASSVLEPMNATALQRVMVDDEDYWHARAVLDEAEGRVSEDAFLGGCLTLLQPKKGFRAAIDPLLLAAAVPACGGDQVLDVGTGTGVAALALLVRVPGAWAMGIDAQPDLIALAERSAQRNDLENCARFACIDIARPKPAMTTLMFDHVMSNPPYLSPDAAQPSADPARALATVESTCGLRDWLGFMTSRLRDGGTLTVVHRADRVSEILDGLGDVFCNVAVLRLLPGGGKPAKRAIVQAVKGASDTALKRGELILHGDDGHFTEVADAVLREAAPLPISSMTD